MRGERRREGGQENSMENSDDCTSTTSPSPANHEGKAHRHSVQNILHPLTLSRKTMAPSSSKTTITQLWLYPVKACGGVSVSEVELTKTGCALDRAFCIVDLDGVNVAKNEAISQRKLNGLATVKVSLDGARSVLTLSAPGMSPLEVRTSFYAHAEGEAIRVECSGKSTTAR